MAQEIKNLLKDYQSKSESLSDDHEALFEKRLDAAFPVERKPNSLFMWIKVAASIVLFLGLGYVTYSYFNKDVDSKNSIVETNNSQENEEITITLGDLSPDLKKVEDFYINGIGLQLASLNKTPENEELVNGYLNKLKELDAAYTKLTEELNTVGPNEATINALIDNLQLRLELLFKLKNKLQQLKELENENTQNMQA